MSHDISEHIAFAEHLASTPSSRWLHEKWGDSILTTVNSARLGLEISHQGMARTVLPVFVGDAQAEMSRLSAPNEELTHKKCLVTHHDARQDAPVRHAINALTGFIESLM